MPPKFQVDQLGAGFIPIGGWYWCPIDEHGYPTEPIGSPGHGPYLLKCLAMRAARKAT